MHDHNGLVNKGRQSKAVMNDDATLIQIPEVSEVRALELLEEDSRVAGWDIEYRQLARGLLVARSHVAQCGEAVLMRETINKRVDVWGQPPQGLVSILFVGCAGGYWSNGADLASEDVLLLTDQADFHITNRANAHALSLHAPMTWLPPPFDEESDLRALKISGGVWCLRGEGHAFAAFRQLCIDALRRPGPHREAVLKRGLQETLNKITSQHVRHRYDLQENHQRLIAASRSYMDKHLGETITMSGLARHIGTSLSTLERAYRGGLEMSPLTYLKLRRLNKVHRVLKDPTNTGTIAEVALDHGFRHLGRFSQEFRHQFGILPSRARQQAFVETTG